MSATHTRSSQPAQASVLSALRFVGKLEGMSFLVLLLVAMPLKYWAGVPLAVKVVGWVHGALFLVLLGWLGAARLKVRLPVRECAWVVLGALLPLGPFWVDRRLAALTAVRDDRR